MSEGLETAKKEKESNQIDEANLYLAGCLYNAHPFITLVHSSGAPIMYYQRKQAENIMRNMTEYWGR